MSQAAEVFAEQPPRSPETIERMAGPAIRRTRRLALGFSICFLAIGVYPTVTSLLDSGWSAITDGTVIYAMLPGAACALACALLIMRDATVSSELVRLGSGHRGVLSRDVSRPGLHIVR